MPTEVEMAMFALLFGHAALALVWLAMNWAPWITDQPTKTRRYILIKTDGSTREKWDVNPKATDRHRFLLACWEFYGTGRGEPDGGWREAAG